MCCLIGWLRAHELKIDTGYYHSFKPYSLAHPEEPRKVPPQPQKTVIAQNCHGWSGMAWTITPPIATSQTPSKAAEIPRGRVDQA